MMASEIFEFDAWAEKWTKTGVPFLSAPTVCLIHPLLSTKSTIFNATLSTHVEKGLSPSYELIGGVSRVWVAVTNVVM